MPISITQHEGQEDGLIGEVKKAWDNVGAFFSGEKKIPKEWTAETTFEIGLPGSRSMNNQHTRDVRLLTAAERRNVQGVNYTQAKLHFQIKVVRSPKPGFTQNVEVVNRRSDALQLVPSSVEKAFKKHLAELTAELDRIDRKSVV